MFRPIVALRVRNLLTGASRKVYALLDSGADIDYLSIEVARFLGIQMEESEFEVASFEGLSNKARNTGNFIIEDIEGIYSEEIFDALIGHFPDENRDLPPAKLDLSEYDHLEDLDFIDIDAKVEMILSVAHSDTWIPDEPSQVRKGNKYQPTAIETIFGWTILGLAGKSNREHPSINFLGRKEKEFDRELIQKAFFETDFPFIDKETKSLSIEAQHALKQMQDTIKFDKEFKMYSVGLPYRVSREEAAKIMNNVDSKGTAIKRAWSLKRSMNRIPDKKEKAFKEAQKFFDQGRAIRLTEEEDKKQREQGLPIWYLPCHLVFQKGKWRFCHDGRAMTNGICINDLLINDLNLMNPLLDPVMNIRSFIYGFSVDIEGFFHHVLLDEKDRAAFRFLWYEDQKMKELFTSIFLRYTFGSSAAPSATTFALQFHSDQLKGIVSDGVRKIMREYFYVDDCGAGDNTITACRALCIELEKAMNMGGFHLAKWKFSDPRINPNWKEGDSTDIAEEDRHQKILGIAWDMKLDAFSVAIEEERFKPRATTPREVVQQQAALYDPLGIVAPFVLLGRQWTQLSMKDNWGWDIKLQPNVERGFNKWTDSIPLLKHLSIPRAFETQKTLGGEQQLHIFCDASTSGFGAVAYLRKIGPNGDIRVSFILGKAHVIPLNPTRTSHHNSTPRMELTASVKGTELLSTILQSYRMPFDRITLWTDSQCVLDQILDTKKSQWTFVANRLSKIHKVSKPEQWKFVKSYLNPADLVSRGIKANETEKWQTYHKGPTWLSTPEQIWPDMNKPDPKKKPEEGKTKDTRRANIWALKTKRKDKEDEPPPPPLEDEKSLEWWYQAGENYSSWSKKTSFLAAVLRCAKIWLLKTQTRAGRKRTEEIEKINQSRAETKKQAENKLIASIQAKEFTEERRELHKKNITKPNQRRELERKSSPLSALNPFLGKDGLIRVGSRLMFSELHEDAKFPIILPKTGQHTSDIIRDEHLKQRHAGPNHTFSQIRQKFWILRGLEQTKKLIHRCISCQIHGKKPMEQKMGYLPQERTDISHPFKNTGLDFAGPFSVRTNGRANVKQYVCLFTCLATRAVYLEAVPSLEADAVLNAIARFTSRNPGVESFYSDNGTNFTAAAKVLHRQLKEIESKLDQAMSLKGFKWSFNPPYSPHRGGAWERLIGVFKRHLSHSLTGDALRYDTFVTVMTEIEAIMNRRPLTKLSTDPKDLSPLTPAHFLRPATIYSPEDASVKTAAKDEKDVLQSSWKRAQCRIQGFKVRFMREYASMLHLRQKWRKTKTDLKVGDMVIRVNENAPRSEWKLGKVVKVHSSGQFVRKVEVLRPDGKTDMRDRTSLVHLEMD